MCNRSPQRIGLHVVHEAPPAVDLDHREPLPVFRLKDRVAADVDLAQVEAELVAERAHLRERALAQVTAFSVVNDDFGYG